MDLELQVFGILGLRGLDSYKLTGKSCSDTFGFSFATKQWISLPSMRHHRSRHAAAVCCGQLYVVGGREILPLSYFDPLRNKRFSKNDNFIKYYEGCTFITLDEELYLIGEKEYNGNSCLHFLAALLQERSGSSEIGCSCCK